MGSTTAAKLAYGYDLGDDGSGWRLRGVDEWEELRLPWLQTGEGAGSFSEQALLHLAQTAGHEVEWSDDAEELLGLQFVGCRGGGRPASLLAAHVITAYLGSSESVDSAELERLRIEQDWDGRLSRALAILGVTPLQERPQWFLCAYRD